MSDDESSGFLSEVRHSMALDAAKKAIWWVLGLIAAGVVLVVTQGGTVPAWTLVGAVVLLLLLFAVIGTRWRRNAGAELEAALDDANVLAFGLERHETYSRHVAQSLDALQRIVSGDIDVSIPHYIEQALLEPARDLLMEKPAENVRLSVLLPRGPDDPTTWAMAWAAGHTLTGKAKYNKRIADTLSRHVYESGNPRYWADVTTDSAFVQNPEASFLIRTMLSLPVKAGDEVLGVFNVVSS